MSLVVPFDSGDVLAFLLVVALPVGFFSGMAAYYLVEKWRR